MTTARCLLEILAIILVFPLCWPFVAKAIWGTKYTWPQLGLNLVLACAFGAGIWQAGRYAQTHDVEIINGAVTGKAQESVSCSHSYPCNCTTDSKGNQSCSTCYEHMQDYDWNRKSTVGTVTIDRVDRQGTEEPPRYSKAQIGDAVAQAHSFTNYVKAAESSLFHDKGSI